MKIRFITAVFLLMVSACLAQGASGEPNSIVETKFRQAIGYFTQKEFDKAREAFAESVDFEAAPYNAIIYYNMASCYQAQAMAEKEKGNTALADGYFVRALEQFQRVQELMPYFPQVYSNTALIYYNQNKPNPAIEEAANFGRQLADGLGAFPPDIENKIYSYRSYEALLSIAGNYIGAGDFENAAKLLKGVVSQMENRPPVKKYMHYTAYNLLGLSLFRLCDLDGAINSFESSIKVDPTQPKLDTSYANLGMLYFNKGDYLNSGEAVKKALAVNPQNATALEYQNKLKNIPGDKSNAP